MFFEVVQAAQLAYVSNTISLPKFTIAVLQF